MCLEGLQVFAKPFCFLSNKYEYFCVTMYIFHQQKIQLYRTIIASYTAVSVKKLKILTKIIIIGFFFLKWTHICNSSKVVSVLLQVMCSMQVWHHDQPGQQRSPRQGKSDPSCAGWLSTYSGTCQERAACTSFSHTPGPSCQSPQWAAPRLTPAPTAASPETSTFSSMLVEICTIPHCRYSPDRTPY